MELDKIVSENVTASIDGSVYTFRPVNISDKIWLKREYGEKLKTMFTPDNIDLEGITRLGYRLLIDKSKFKPVSYTDHTESGEEFTVSIGGVELFRRSIKTDKGTIALINAVGDCMINGEPEPEEKLKEPSEAGSLYDPLV